jgi:hypothetical protein
MLAANWVCFGFVWVRFPDIGKGRNTLYVIDLYLVIRFLALLEIGFVPQYSFSRQRLVWRG